MPTSRELKYELPVSSILNSAVTNAADLVSQLDAMLSANGWTKDGDTYTSDASVSDRTDLAKANERVNLEVTTTAISVGQAITTQNLVGLSYSADISGVTYPANLTAITDGTVTNKGTFLVVIIEDTGGLLPPVTLGLPFRVRENSNLRLAATLDDANRTIQVILPKNLDGDFFYPGYLDPPTNAPSKVIAARIAGGTDIERLIITAVANINTTAGTADVTFDNDPTGAITGTYPAGSLVGVDPIPFSGFAGGTGTNNVVEGIALESQTAFVYGDNSVENSLVRIGYASSEQTLKGLLPLVSGLVQPVDPSDFQTYRVIDRDDRSVSTVHTVRLVDIVTGKRIAFQG